MARLSQSSQHSPEPPKSRKRKSDAHDGEEHVQKRSKKFSYLKSKTKHISQDLVRIEWRSLPKPAQLAVREIFLAAKRTTLTQILDGPRRREAEFVVNDVLRRLERQLPRMPFPPGTKREGFDLDGVLENVRMLEAEKAPLADSVKLLEEEIEREEQRVEAKRKELSRLEKEAKAAAKTRKQRAAKTHPLLDATDAHVASKFDKAEDISLVPDGKHSAIIFDEDDEDLAPILSQLQSHLESIKANTGQIPGIDVEMKRTQAALYAFQAR